MIRHLKDTIDEYPFQHSWNDVILFRAFVNFAPITKLSHNTHSTFYCIFPPLRSCRHISILTEGYVSVQVPQKWFNNFPLPFPDKQRTLQCLSAMSHRRGICHFQKRFGRVTPLMASQSFNLLSYTIRLQTTSTEFKRLRLFRHTKPPRLYLGFSSL